MGQAKVKEQTEKEEARLYAVQRMPSDVRVGDRIVTVLNRGGSVKKSLRVSQKDRGQCCRHYHINRTLCYHRDVPMLIAVTESEMLSHVMSLAEAISVPGVEIEEGTE